MSMLSWWCPNLKNAALFPLPIKFAVACLSSIEGECLFPCQMEIGGSVVDDDGNIGICQTVAFCACYVVQRKSKVVVNRHVSRWGQPFSLKRASVLTHRAWKSRNGGTARRTLRTNVAYPQLNSDGIKRNVAAVRYGYEG